MPYDRHCFECHVQTLIIIKEDEIKKNNKTRTKLYCLRRFHFTFFIYAHVSTKTNNEKQQKKISHDHRASAYT